MKSKDEKETNAGPQFVGGVIVKITDDKPLPARKIIKVRSSAFSLSFSTGRKKLIIKMF